MTALAAEAAETAAPAAAESAAPATASRATSASRAPAPARGRPGAAGPPGPSGPPGKQGSQSTRSSKSTGSKRRSKGDAFTPGQLASETKRRTPTTPSAGKNYQPAILAEFVAAVLLVSVTPFASSKNPEGLSPYGGADMVKLIALTLVYFILALISGASSGAGKFAALFGLLILLGVGLNEAANLVAAFDLLAGIAPPGGSSMNKEK